MVRVNDLQTPPSNLVVVRCQNSFIFATRKAKGFFQTDQSQKSQMSRAQNNVTKAIRLDNVRMSAVRNLYESDSVCSV